MAKLVFIDTETTGLDNSRHEIIEIAALIVLDDGTKQFWHKRIAPAHIATADPVALEINGYTPSDWANAPEFKDIADVFGIMLDGCVVVGHNVAFDIGFINKAFKRCGHRIPRLRGIDTITLVHEHLTPIGCPDLSMDTVRAFLGWVRPTAHTAATDVYDCYDLYMLLARASVWLRFKLFVGHMYRLWRDRKQSTGKNT